MLFDLAVLGLAAMASVHASHGAPRSHRHHMQRLAARTAAYPDWSYTGCIKDAASLRALSGSSSSSGSNTPDQCISKCENAGYTLAGMQYGVQCYCGNAVSSSGSSASEAECSTPCGGDKTQKCGGLWRMSLYTKYTPEYLGCFADQSNPRTLPISGPDSGWLTTEQCQDSCSSRGYPFAGTSYGRQCWCSKTAPAANKAVAEKDCNFKCMGNKDQTCGGLWRLSVYDVSGAISASVPSSLSSSRSTSFSPLSTTAKPSTSSTKQPTTSVTAKASTSPAPTTTSKPSTTSTKPPTTSVTATPSTSPPQTTTSKPSSSSVKPTSASESKTTVASSVTSAAPAGSTAAGGSIAPRSSSQKNVFAHHMVGNTYSYTAEQWASDISMAAAAGIDGFALNIGNDYWGWDRVVDAYAAAKSFGPSFKLFISFDMNSFGCGSPADGANLAKWISEYSEHPNQAFVDGKQMASTFSGGNCYFGQGSVNDGWNSQFRAPLTAQNISLHFVPASFSDVSTYSASWMDGNFAWNAGWPMGAADLDTSEDQRQMAALGNKDYMAAISPAFFTYYGPWSWNKNWIYRGDDWLLATRFEDVIAMRDKVDSVELITWNDYGESHYLGPVRVDQPNSQGWTDGMPHTAWLQLVSYYAAAFKTGSYSTPSSDSLVLWSRPHPKSAVPSAPSMGRPTGADNTDDNLYAVALLKAAATVTIYSGSNTQTWILPAGLTKMKLTSASGAIGGKIMRGGSQVAAYDSEGEFTYTESPVDYNFNYFVAST